MGFTDFKGIQEMGIICGGGLLVCLVPMLTLAAGAAVARAAERPGSRAGGQPDHRARIENLWLRRPVLVLLVTAVCLWAGFHARNVVFDYNLLNMQSDGLPAVEFEKKLIHSTDKSVLFGAVLADTPEEAQRIEAELKALPTVADVESMSQFLVENPEPKSSSSSARSSRAAEPSTLPPPTRTR